jgi:hypothetical protein
MGDFPFVGTADRTTAIACLLLPFLRALIDSGTPLHLFDKPTAGTGASLLAELIGVIATGRPPGALSEGSEAAEWGKCITAALLQAQTLIVIDNVKRLLNSGDLAKALTARLYQGRILGQSRLVDLPNEAVWVATGNNVRLSDEITRRTVRIRMDANVDMPWQGRQFRHPDLRRFVAANRGHLVAAALTLGQAWIAAGRPAGTESLGMFEAWASTLGGVLHVAGLPEFLGNQQKLYEEANSEAAPWMDLVAEWWKRYADSVMTVADIWRLVNPFGAACVDFNLGHGNEHALQTKLGIRLRQARDRHFGPYKLVLVGKSHSAQTWRLVPSLSGSSLSSQPVPHAGISVSPQITGAPPVSTAAASSSTATLSSSAPVPASNAQFWTPTPGVCPIPALVQAGIVSSSAPSPALACCAVNVHEDVSVDSEQVAHVTAA